jgi:hypothetical protein
MRLGPSASNTVVLALPLEVIDAMRAYIARTEGHSRGAS